jgi:Zn-dependent oligopeptidase
MPLKSLKKLGRTMTRSSKDVCIDHVMSVGDTVDPAEGFRKFRGRDVDTKALLRKRGFPVGED